MKLLKLSERNFVAIDQIESVRAVPCFSMRKGTVKDWAVIISLKSGHVGDGQSIQVPTEEEALAEVGRIVLLINATQVTATPAQFEPLQPLLTRRGGLPKSESDVEFSEDSTGTAEASQAISDQPASAATARQALLQVLLKKLNRPAINALDWILGRVMRAASQGEGFLNMENPGEDVTRILGLLGYDVSDFRSMVLNEAGAPDVVVYRKRGVLRWE